MQTSLCFWTFPRSLANANIFVSKRGYKSTNPRLALELINTRSPEKRAFIIPIRDHIATILLITTESKWNYLNYHRPTRSGRIGENAINNLRGILLFIPAIINQQKCSPKSQQKSTKIDERWTTKISTLAIDPRVELSLAPRHESKTFSSTLEIWKENSRESGEFVDAVRKLTKNIFHKGSRANTPPKAGKWFSRFKDKYKKKTKIAPSKYIFSRTLIDSQLVV